MGITAMLWGKILITMTMSIAVALSTSDKTPMQDVNPGGAAIIITDAMSKENKFIDNWNSIVGRVGCSPKKSCTNDGGYCVKYISDCNGTLDSKGCKGKKCKCCKPDVTTSAPVGCPVVMCDHCQAEKGLYQENWLNVTNSLITNQIDCNFGLASEDPENVSWTWCDSTLGCLNITDAWYSPSERPCNFVPSSRDSITTQFFIHTRKKRNANINHEVLAHDPTTLNGTDFDATKPTKFIIHGFIHDGNLQWLKDFAQDFLNYGDYNVFRVNWGGGSFTNYGKAVANTRVVGLEIGYLVNWLVENYGLDPADVHLLGHSLGSHISGYAGEQIPGLGRISGLDPAGPYFTNMPSFVRLDETDAIFVDNYHTDSTSTLLGVVYGLGTTQAMGNVDFYPNGGRIQPGCDLITTSAGIAFIKPGNLIGDGSLIVACSHSRAHELYRDTLRQPCSYTARECSSYAAFKTGRCGSCNDHNIRCSPIGIRASEYTHKERVNVEMYFDTDATAPYCCPATICEDKSENCKSWKKKGWCKKTKRREFMREECPKACKLC